MKIFLVIKESQSTGKVSIAAFSKEQTAQCFQAEQEAKNLDDNWCDISLLKLELDSDSFKVL